MLSTELVDEFQTVELDAIASLQRVHEVNLVIQTLMLAKVITMDDGNVTNYQEFLKAGILEYQQSIADGQKLVDQMVSAFQIGAPPAATT